MDGKAMLIDTTRCTGCRACQVACKSWNQNGADSPSNRGSHQNPGDLDGQTFKLVRFKERPAEAPNSAPVWYFFSDQCRHCLSPDCKDAIEGYVSGGVIQDLETGAVVYTEKARLAAFQDVRDVCPYDIPRRTADGRIVKCTFCIDRISNGLLPACAVACPTGAIRFGDRDEILRLGHARVDALKPACPKTRLLDEDYVRVIFVVVDDPQRYHENAVARVNHGLTRSLALRRILRSICSSSFWS
ncbi:4Fe-4S dicluster domain-containing protein [Desulfatiglans anilini]|uniref:4Fe-4S dicluster domain-containing protein n=1 Tax=Desulfatiglans anilini TaxID=90728 RepID=UPI000427F0C8|nr:4Fe-4S dicluster domain-containing protein [Desulfatiglans anilini]